MQHLSKNLNGAPESIHDFEWLMYSSVVGYVILCILQYTPFGHSILENISYELLKQSFNGLESSILLWIAGTALLPVFSKLVFVYLVVYKRLNWSRIVLATMVALTVYHTSISMVPVFGPGTNTFSLLYAVPMLLEVLAIYCVFSSSASKWLVAVKIFNPKTQYRMKSLLNYTVKNILLGLPYLGLLLYNTVMMFALAGMWDLGPSSNSNRDSELSLALLSLSAIFFAVEIIISYLTYKNLGVKDYTSSVGLLKIIGLRIVVFGCTVIATLVFLFNFAG